MLMHATDESNWIFWCVGRITLFVAIEVQLNASIICHEMIHSFIHSSRSSIGDCH